MEENQIELMVENDQILATSLQIAEHFGKLHKDVLETIRKMTAENSALLEMFYETTYKSIQNKKLPMYLINRDGFSLLVMGFTGKKALEWKLKYIDAFNTMEEKLKMNERKLANELENKVSYLTGQVEALTTVLKEIIPIIGQMKNLSIGKDKPVSQNDKIQKNSNAYVNSENRFIKTLLPDLHEAGIDISCGDLYSWFRENDLLKHISGPAWNSPKKWAIEAGFFKTKTSIVKKTGKEKQTAVLTDKGQEEFMKFFTKPKTMWYWQEYGKLPEFDYWAR